MEPITPTEIMVMSILLVIAFIGYMLPWIVALFRGHKRTGGVALLCLFTAWSIIGWVIAMAWAVMGDGRDDA